MARYRKIDIHTWGDENFKSLSPIPPCGQGLWFFLLTGPFTGPIPGLFNAGRAAMAEALGWSLEAFDIAFQEVFTKGMVKADWKARLVWLPNAIKYNNPESPNVITSWGKELDTLPECRLLHEALNTIRETICKMDGGFIVAFDKAFGKALLKTMPNQEQEQEQEQYKDNTPPQAATLKPFEVTVPEKTDPLYNEIKTAFEKVNGNFTNYGKEGKAIKLIIKMANGDKNAIHVMIRTFFTLRQRNDKYWSSMPFIPSRLAASGVWDGVKEEAKKILAATDTSWIDAMVKEEVAV